MTTSCPLGAVRGAAGPRDAGGAEDDLVALVEVLRVRDLPDRRETPEKAGVGRIVWCPARNLFQKLGENAGALIHKL